MIKIVHTADLHLGLEFSSFPTLADQLKQERLNAIHSIVSKANDERAHAIVVAGDLFDKLSVSQKLVKDAKAILAEFEGEVLVIPGNHDWYNKSANENRVWTWFTDAPGERVHFLNQQIPYTFILNDRQVAFFPCGCHQKHCTENNIGWVLEENKEETAVNIGIAHGNVEGFGLDTEGNYFSMTTTELKNAGVDCWLLGHIHAPYPNSDTAGHEPFFFAGNHCSYSWKHEREGGSWLIEIDEHKAIKASRWKHEGICFKDRNYNIHSLITLQEAINDLKKLDATKTMLRLTLNGSLPDDELHECKTQITDIAKQFLFCEPQFKIALRLSPETIDKLFIKETIAHTLLTTLSSSKDDALAMQLAFQTIKNMSK